ncbi:ABC transporter ATP-binding protein [Streptomyces olivoreticuli]
MPGTPHALSVRDVHKSYGTHEVLRGVSLTLAPGTLAGLVGENGAGKTTLLRILCGQIAADAGEVEHLGALGYCPQDTVLNDFLTVEQHVRYFRSAYGLDNVDRAEELIEELHFAEYRHTRVDALSGGTRQKLNLTLALMHDPQVLLLDEPYQGFDWETYLRFWDLAAGLRDRGRCVLVVSHLAWDTERLDELHRLRDGVAARWEPGRGTTAGSGAAR